MRTRCQTLGHSFALARRDGALDHCIHCGRADTLSHTLTRYLSTIEGFEVYASLAERSGLATEEVRLVEQELSELEGELGQLVATHCALLLG